VGGTGGRNGNGRGGAVLGIVEAPSGTPSTTSRPSLPSHPPTTTIVPPAAPASVTPPGPPDPPPPGPLTVNGPAWAGHGDLAFVSTGQLEVLSNAGSLTKITGPSSGGFDSNPAWSPDEQWLAFLHTGPANGFELAAPTLWLVEAGSSQAEEVTTSGIGMFAWSPTAPVLAYTLLPNYNFPAGVPEDLWFDRPGAPPTSVAVGTGAGVGSIAWSPDGSELAFDDSVFPQPASATSPATPAMGQLGTVSVNGGQVTTVYLLAESGIDLAGWWPEGGGLLFWEDTVFSASIEADGLTLYSLEFGSAQPVALTTSLVGSTWLAPQPGGDAVAVVSGGADTFGPQGETSTCAVSRPPPANQCPSPSARWDWRPVGHLLVCSFSPWPPAPAPLARPVRPSFRRVGWPNGTRRMLCGRWSPANHRVP
jgi:dipeptidyl aminopeptidase/acylaminoacyl peptidase